MKKLLLLFSLLLIVLLTTCEIGDKTNFKDECKPMDPYCVKPLNVTLDYGETLSIKTWIWQARNDTKPYDIGTSVVSNENFGIIKEYIKNQISEEHHIHAFTLFIDKMISSESNFNLDDLIGFCVYIIEDNKMYQKLFTKKGSAFVLNSDFGGEVGSLEYNSLGFYTQSVFETSHDCSYILIRNTDHEKPNLIRSKNKVLGKIRLFGFKQKVTGALHNRNSGIPSSTCLTPCSLQPFAYCDEGEGWPWPDPQCKPGTCFIESTYERASKSQQDIDGDFPISYAFRDSFLVNSDFGRNYIDFYYYLGEQIQVGDLSLDLALDLIDVFYDSRESIEVILSPGADTSTFILINSNMRASAIAALDDLRNLTSDTLLLEVLDTVEAHIRLYEGEKAADVIRECCKS